MFLSGILEWKERTLLMGEVVSSNLDLSVFGDRKKLRCVLLHLTGSNPVAAEFH